MTASEPSRAMHVFTSCLIKKPSRPTDPHRPRVFAMKFSECFPWEMGRATVISLTQRSFLHSSCIRGLDHYRSLHETKDALRQQINAGSIFRCAGKLISSRKNSVYICMRIHIRHRFTCYQYVREKLVLVTRLLSALSWLETKIFWHFLPISREKGVSGSFQIYHIVRASPWQAVNVLQSP